MAFFGNGAVNRVNLHYGVKALARSGGGIFVLVFLIRAGIPIPIVLLTVAATHALRFCLRPLILPLARRWGLKPPLIAGTLIMAADYPLLARVHGLGVTLVILCVVSAVSELLYYPNYNAYFSAIGDAEHRGHQVSAREAMVALAGIVAPLAGAWALVTFGPTPMFAGVALIQLLSAIPLIGAPNIRIASQAPGAFAAARLGGLLQACDGWFDGGFFVVWEIALFVSLGHDLAAYGGAMALAGLVGAAGGLVLGRYVDQGHGWRTVIVVTAVAATVVGLRAAAFGSPWMAVAANALGALVMPLMMPSFASPVYNMAQAAPCPLRFHLVTESAWDLGCITALLIAAGLTAAGVSLAAGILLSLPALAVWTWLLRRYYARPMTAPPVSSLRSDPPSP